MKITNYDHQTLKNDLVGFLKSNPQFQDFDYEGSTINTIIDLLVRNTFYSAYASNMIATESFLDSAKIRSNVVSHAQKLSYIPKSKVASTMIVDVVIKADDGTTQNIVEIPKGFSFAKKVNSVSYRFVTTESHNAVLDGDSYIAKNVILKQGVLVSEKFVYKDLDIIIKNKDVDISTLKVFVSKPTATTKDEYHLQKNIIKSNKDDLNYFVFENTKGTHTIQFGRNVLGKSPDLGDIVTIEYVVCEDDHANGLDAVIPLNAIESFSNIVINVVQAAFGGSDKEDVESIKFIAPRIYKTQQRAVTEDDYIAIIMDKFPFIKSCNVWSGADHAFVDYGSIYISCSPVGGYGFSDSIKEEIVEALRQYKVGISRINVVDAVNTYINVDIIANYQNDKTLLSWSNTQSKIAANIKKFEADNLAVFNGKFNATKFASDIIKNSDVDTIDVKTSIAQNYPIVHGLTSVYNYTFENRLVEGSLRMSSNVIFSYDLDEQRLYDRSGYVYIKNNKGLKDIVVGTIDYETGVVSIKTNILEGDELSITVNTESSNINSKNNVLLHFGKISIGKG